MATENDEPIVTTKPLKDQFKRIERRIRAIAKGTTSAGGTIICGPPGWGKTYTVRRILQQEGSGWVPLSINNEHALVMRLWANRDKSVFVADDTDQLATRLTCLNIIKGAFGPDREVIWDSRKAQDTGRPPSQFKLTGQGRLIWISNENYADLKNRRKDLEAHWRALASRGIRPIWLGTTDQEDAFRYIVRLACTTPSMWHLQQPLGKVKAEAVIRFFCDNRDHLLELSPRTLTDFIIDAFHTYRDDIEARESELKELLSDEPQRKIPPITVPTIVGHTWQDVPEVRGSSSSSGVTNNEEQHKAKPNVKPATKNLVEELVTVARKHPATRHERIKLERLASFFSQ